MWKFIKSRILLSTCAALVSLLLLAIFPQMTRVDGFTGRQLTTRGFGVLIALLLLWALFLFFLKVTCQMILHRQFDREYFQYVVRNLHLEFPSLRKSLEDGAPAGYFRLHMMLRCDFLALTYILKNAADLGRRDAFEAWLLALYFKSVLVSLPVRHLLKLREAPAILKLTAILQYFANVAGERPLKSRSGRPRS